MKQLGCDSFTSVVRGSSRNVGTVHFAEACLIFNSMPCYCHHDFFWQSPRKMQAGVTSHQQLCNRGAHAGRLASAGTSLASWQPPCPLQVAIKPAFYSSLFWLINFNVILIKNHSVKGFSYSRNEHRLQPSGSSHLENGNVSWQCCAGAR